MEKAELIDQVFVDSNVFIALNDPTDSLHNRATKLSSYLSKKHIQFFTSTNVLLESVTLLSQRLSHQEAVDFLDSVRTGSITIIHPNESLVFEGEEIFRKQKSKNVSYADCLSFAIMQEREIRYAFSFNQDFAKNGFKLIEDLVK